MHVIKNFVFFVYGDRHHSSSHGFTSAKTIKCFASIWICKWNADVKTQKRIFSKQFHTARVTLLSVEHLRTPGDDPN